MVPMVNVVEVVQVVGLLDRIACRGVVDRALRSAGLDRTALRAGPGLLPYEIEAALLDAVARRLGDGHLGSRLAAEFDYASYGAYARYVLGAPDLRTAFLRGRDAFSLLHRGSEIVFREEGGHLLVGRASRLAPSAGRRHLDEGSALLIGDVARHFLGPDWRPDWIEAGSDSRPCLAGFEEIAEAPVQGGASMPAVAIRLRDLATPNPLPPTARETVTQEELPSLMGVLQPSTLAEAVRGVLRAQIVRSDVSEESVARRLGLGPRTLQRRLQAEGTGFREIRTRVLEGRARALLCDTRLTVDEIAASLGYAEPNSFRRAFRSWTGLSPAAYRARVDAG